jgi:hypothetical protein
MAASLAVGYDWRERLQALKLEALAPPKLDETDAKELEWFFGPARTFFERSTFGAILRQIERDAYISNECPACKGKGLLEEEDLPANRACYPCEKRRGDEASKCVYCYGTLKIQAGCWCRRCRGVGALPVREKRANRALTVRSTGRSGGYEVADEDLRRYARAARRVDRMGEGHPELVQALAAYHGDVGARYANKMLGRRFALYCLTPAGETLLKRSMKQSAEGLTLMAYERIEAEAEAERQQSKPNRKALLETADRQAAELYDRACHRWNVLFRSGK